ncbi:MAG: hypothetical protein HQL22_12445 [Candidatus Omnitrophica bacterium]|nr:hypothetical protein [Candidatus Omnitrophota bacterium]
MNNNLWYCRRGSLAISLLVVVVLVTLSAAFLVRGANEKQDAGRVVSSSAALWAAEAGLQKVLWEYTRNTCGNMVKAMGYTGCNGDKTLAGTLNGYGDFDATLDSANTLVQSTGSIPSRTAANRVQRHVKVIIGKPAIFSYGMFAQGKVTVSNNALVDAYDSSKMLLADPTKKCPYGAVCTDNKTNIDHINGDVGSNGTASGIVEVDNNANVWGDVSTGPGGTVTNSGIIHGSIANTNSVALPVVVVPPTLTGLASSGTLSTVNNGAKTINAGDYKYTAMSLGNNSAITINGNVRLYFSGGTAIDSGNNTTISIATGASLVIYTDGKITFANNTNVNSVAKQPKDLQIYSTYTGASGVNVSNNSATYAAIYAPQTDVNVSNNAGLYGAIVGKTTTLNNNGDVHYDTALASLANPYEDAIVSQWQEY